MSTTTTVEPAEIVALARFREQLARGDGMARRIRERAHLSRTEVAHALGVTREAIQAWESCRVSPRPDVARRYAALLKELADIPGCEGIDSEGSDLEAAHRVDAAGTLSRHTARAHVA